MKSNFNPNGPNFREKNTTVGKWIFGIISLISLFINGIRLSVAIFFLAFALLIFYCVFIDDNGFPVKVFIKNIKEAKVHPETKVCIIDSEGIDLRVYMEVMLSLYTIILCIIIAFISLSFYIAWFF